QAEDGIRDFHVTGVETCALPISNALLFFGLSFGMIISVALASHCLGRALVAFNVRTQMPRIGPWARETIAVLQTLIAEQQADVEIGRASCRERGEDWDDAGLVKK